MKKLITITSLTCLGIFGLASCTTVEPAPATTSTTTTRESTTAVAPTTATQTTTTRGSGGY